MHAGGAAAPAEVARGLEAVHRAEVESFGGSLAAILGATALLSAALTLKGPGRGPAGPTSRGEVVLDSTAGVPPPSGALHCMVESREAEEGASEVRRRETASRGSEVRSEGREEEGREEDEGEKERKEEREEEEDDDDDIDAGSVMSLRYSPADLTLGKEARRAAMEGWESFEKRVYEMVNGLDEDGMRR